MNKFNWVKGVSFGIAIWLIIFALVSALVGFKVFDNFVTQAIIVLIAGILAYVFAGNAKVATTGQAFGYGFLWVVIGLALDVLITYRFNSNVFRQWQYWLSYVFILFAPTLRSGSFNAPIQYSEPESQA